MSAPLPLFFALHGSQEYAARVAQRFGCSLSAHEEREFEDGEHKSRPLDNVNGRPVVVIHGLHGDSRHSANDKLCRLLFFCGALKDAGARHLQVVTPYLCYARKERRTQPQDPIITRYVAALIEACGVDRLMTLEVHNLAAFDNAFRIPTQHLAAAELFAEHFASLSGAAEVVAVSPDAGGAKRAEQFRQALQRRLGRPVGSAYMEKYRSNDVVTGALLVGEVRGKLAIIVDDLISTGGTLLRAGAGLPGRRRHSRVRGRRPWPVHRRAGAARQPAVRAARDLRQRAAVPPARRAGGAPPADSRFDGGGGRPAGAELRARPAAVPGEGRPCPVTHAPSGCFSAAT